MPEERLNGHDFIGKGYGWDGVWDILVTGCEVPPSLEGFEHGLEQARTNTRKPLSIQKYARALADNYQRIR